MKGSSDPKSKKVDLGQTLNPLNLTAEAAIENGTLKILAKAVNEVTLIRHFFYDLLEKEVGTGKLEKEAFEKLRDVKSRIIQGRGPEIGIANMANILKFREPWMVKNVLELKIKSVQKEENEHFNYPVEANRGNCGVRGVKV